MYSKNMLTQCVNFSVLSGEMVVVNPHFSKALVGIYQVNKGKVKVGIIFLV